MTSFERSRHSNAVESVFWETLNQIYECIWNDTTSDKSFCSSILNLSVISSSSLSLSIQWMLHWGSCIFVLPLELHTRWIDSFQYFNRKTVSNLAWISILILDPHPKLNFCKRKQILHWHLRDVLKLDLNLVLCFIYSIQMVNNR